MRAILVAVLILFATVARAWNTKDYEDFLVGLGEGLQADFASNITQCIEDEDYVYNHLNEGFKLLDQGISNKNPFKIVEGVKDLGAALGGVSSVVRDCGFIEAAEDIDKIVTAFESGIGGIVEVVIKECIGIFVKHRQVYDDITTASKAWKNGDYKNSGYAIGNLIGILIQNGKK